MGEENLIGDMFMQTTQKINNSNSPRNYNKGSLACRESDLTINKTEGKIVSTKLFSTVLELSKGFWIFLSTGRSTILKIKQSKIQLRVQRGRCLKPC